jgi:hypothetical protein
MSQDRLDLDLDYGCGVSWITWWEKHQEARDRGTIQHAIVV